MYAAQELWAWVLDFKEKEKAKEKPQVKVDDKVDDKTNDLFLLCSELSEDGARNL